jgi:hypothetical protein
MEEESKGQIRYEGEGTLENPFTPFMAEKMPDFARALAKEQVNKIKEGKGTLYASFNNYIIAIKGQPNSQDIDKVVVGVIIPEDKKEISVNEVNVYTKYAVRFHSAFLLEVLKD